MDVFEKREDRDVKKGSEGGKNETRKRGMRWWFLFAAGLEFAELLLASSLILDFFFLFARLAPFPPSPPLLLLLIPLPFPQNPFLSRLALLKSPPFFFSHSFFLLPPPVPSCASSAQEFRRERIMGRDEGRERQVEREG